MSKLDSKKIPDEISTFDYFKSKTLVDPKIINDKIKFTFSPSNPLNEKSLQGFYKGKMGHASKAIRRNETQIIHT